MRTRSWVPLSIRFAVVVFAALGGGAMVVYPGGNAFSPGSRGHHFWHNFLCDVLNPVAINGQSNRWGACLMAAAVGVIYLGALVPLWWSLPAKVLKVRWVGDAARILGVLSFLGIWLLPLSAFGWLSLPHHEAVLFAAIPGLLATFLVGVCASLAPGATRWLALLSAALLLVALLDTFVYVRVVYFRVPLTPIVPAMQRVVVLLLVAWLLALSSLVDKPNNATG